MPAHQREQSAFFRVHRFKVAIAGSIFGLLASPGHAVDNTVGLAFYGVNACGKSSSFNLTCIGHSSGFETLNGAGNTYLGSRSGYWNVNGDDNTFLGFGSGENNTASDNTFVGTFSGNQNTSGAYNTCVGKSSCYENMTGNRNTITGFASGRNNTVGFRNAYYGFKSGFNAPGNNNVFIEERMERLETILTAFDAHEDLNAHSGLSVR